MQRLLQILRFRLRALFSRRTVRQETADELRFHVERETQANMARGMSTSVARQTALASFGGVERFMEQCHDERDVRWLQDLGGDVRHAFRLLRTNTVYSVAVIATLALGIGATSTIYAIVHTVLLRPLPFPDPDRIMSLSHSQKGSDRQVISDIDYRAWRANAGSFSAIAAYSGALGVLTGNGEPEELNGAAVFAPFFPALGVNPILGRAIRAEEEEVGAPRVVLLSHALWQSHFGGDSAIVGKTITLSGTQRTVIGIMPPGFDFPDRAQFWAALRLPALPDTAFIERYIQGVARLRDGVSPEAARSELQAITRDVDKKRQEMNRGAQVMSMTLHDRLFGSARRPLSLLFGAVVLLLLVACANVANLTLARSATRSREFAVRLALGAGRWRLARQLFIESTLLAGIGGAIGALVPFALLGMIVRLSPTSVAGVQNIPVDGTVMLFTAAVTLVAALLFGLAPAFTGYRVGTVQSLKAGASRVTASRSHNTMRSALVVTELAAALTLLTGAGLVTRSFARAIAVDPGFEPAHVMGVHFTLSRIRYADDSSALRFHRTLAQRVRELPGVDEVALADALPAFGYMMTQPIPSTPDNGNPLSYVVSAVTPAYPRAIGMRLREGRLFNDGDRMGTPAVAILTTSAARSLFPNRTAIGQVIPRKYGDAEVSPVVVGIVDDMTQLSVEARPLPHVFLSAEQVDGYPSYLVIRSTMAPEAMKAAVARLVRAIDPLQPVSRFVSVSNIISESLAPRRLNSMVINAFAWLAMLLSMIGLYGLMTHAVTTRSQELGIRMALGAGHGNVIRLILRQALILSVAGIVIGVALSLALSRTMSSLLFDVGTRDPVTFILAPTVLAIVALVSCYIPARRATQVDPISALRAD